MSRSGWGLRARRSAGRGATTLACAFWVGCAARDADAPATPTSEVTCADGEVYDGDTCVPAACGPTRWDAGERGPDDVFVDAAADGGDGSEDAPLASLVAGVELAVDRGGGTVHLASGTYPEILALDSGADGVSIAGRCPELVTLDGGGGEEPTFRLTGGRRAPVVELSGVTVTGGRFGVYVDGATLGAERVRVTSNRLVGIVAINGSTVTLADGESSDNLSEDGLFGRGIGVQSGASLAATRFRADRNHDSGIYVADPGTHVELTDVGVDGTLLADGPDTASGVAVYEGDLIAERLAVSNSVLVGVVVSLGARADLTDLAILGTSTRADGAGGYCLQIGEGSTVDVAGARLDGCAVTGVLVGGEGATASIADAQITETSAGVQVEVEGEEEPGGASIAAQEGGLVLVERTTLEDIHHAGLFADGVGTGLEFRDGEIGGVAALPEQPASAILADDGALVIVAGTTVHDVEGAGATATGGGSVLELSGVTLSDLRRAEPDGAAYGYAVTAWSGGTTLLEDVTVERATEVAVLAGAGGSVSATGSTIRETRSNQDATMGVGAFVDAGGALAFRDGEVTDCGAAGLAASGDGAALEIDEVRVEDTRRDGANQVGVGVLAQSGATATATGLTVSGTEGFGVFVTGASLDCVACTLVENSYAGAGVATGTLRFEFTGFAIGDPVAETE